MAAVVLAPGEVVGVVPEVWIATSAVHVRVAAFVRSIQASTMFRGMPSPTRRSIVAAFLAWKMRSGSARRAITRSVAADGHPGGETGPFWHTAVRLWPRRSGRPAGGSSQGLVSPLARARRQFTAGGTMHEPPNPHRHERMY